jgi:hypothetical protein
VVAFYRSSEPRAVWTTAGLTIMIVNVGVSRDTERLARALFGPDQIERSNDNLFAKPPRKNLE